ncbi:MAG TPA: hypothetical protein VIM46_01715 [Luteolibacter sp.]
MERLRKSRLLLGALAGALLFPFALMLVMSAWAPLHHDLHCDAGHPDHQCEVTLWQSGAVDTAAPAMAAPQPAPEVALPDIPPPCRFPNLTATHFLGGVLAQGPPRGP